MSRFYALDFDRTLGRTTDIAKEFIGYVEQSNAAAGDALRAEQHNVESTGGSFDMITTLRAQLGAQALGDCVDGFLADHRKPSYLEDGARPLLDGITAKGHQLGIVTYGGEDWQKIKLRATALDAYHYMILAQKGVKGAMIASWYDAEQGKYQLPAALGGGQFDEVVLVDDKPIEFAGLPDTPSAQGYLFTGGSKIAVEASTQPVAGTLPQNVRTVESLYDVVRQEGLEA